MSIQDREREFHVWAASSGAINHREALGGLYWAQAAWKHQQSRIDQLEKELAEAWKDAERYRWLRNDCSQTMCRELFGVEGAEDELDEAIDEAIEAEWEGSVRFAAIDKAIKQETP